MRVNGTNGYIGGIEKMSKASSTPTNRWVCCWSIITYEGKKRMPFLSETSKIFFLMVILDRQKMCLRRFATYKRTLRMFLMTQFPSIILNVH